MRRRIPTLLLALATTALAGRAGVAKGPEIFPLSEVRPGLKGYGLTVLRGTKPERFEFEVIGVAKNMLPKMDIILVKSDDPKLKLPGMAKGMSGSPLFIDGKVMCAFSYAWAFAKIPMGGCTPIKYMLAEAEHPWRQDPGRLALADEWRRYQPLARATAPLPAASGADWFATMPLPERPPAPPPDTSLQRASMPLMVSGLGPSAFEQARTLFEPYHIEPMQGAGGAGDPNGGPKKFEMGGNIAVKLSTGDFTSSVLCTVSYIDGSKVLGCGHPMFTLGEVDFPATTALVHTIMPSAQIAFKLASPMREIGALVQDRKSAIVADTARRATMVPVDITIKTMSGSRSFHTKVVQHRFLTPQPATMSLASALELIAPDITDATVTLRSTVNVKGHDPLYFTDYVYSPEGLSLATLATSRGLRVLVPLLFNPFEPVRLERVEIEANLLYKADFAAIVGLRVPDLELPVDRETSIDVDLRPYNGHIHTVRIPITIPRRLAGSLVKIEVVPGDKAQPDSAPPQNLDQVLDTLRNKTFPANVLVATVYTPEEGVTMSGMVLPELPDSALDTAIPSTATKSANAYRSILRATIPLDAVATGKKELVVKIADPK